ncbi:hypothetical protein [Streptomyces sp. NPDC046712]|uniref:hypothetical protein n=1 Tax=Streptomyces sp. NPDC046712 TaxID=3154802 RepID=UPI0033CD21FA
MIALTVSVQAVSGCRDEFLAAIKDVVRDREDDVGVGRDSVPISQPGPGGRRRHAL